MAIPGGLRPPLETLLIPPFNQEVKINPVKKWCVQQADRLNAKVSYAVLFLLGLGFGLISTSLLSGYKRSWGDIALLTSGGAINLLGLAILYGSNTLEKIKKYERDAEKGLIAFHKAENFRSSLSLTRHLYHALTNFGFSTKAELLREPIKTTEQRFLTKGPGPYLFDERGLPSAAMTSFLKWIGANIQNPTLASINKYFQENLVNPSEEFLNTKFHANFAEFLAHVKDMGFSETVPPSFAQYGAVVLTSAAAFPNLQEQIAYLIEQWNRGVRWESIMVYTSNREFDPKIENAAAFLNVANCPFKIRADWDASKVHTPATVAEMIPFLWDQAELPQELKNVKLINANAAEFKKLQATQSTAALCLFVSSAPAIPHFNLIYRTTFKFPFDIAGPKMRDEKVKIYLRQIVDFTKERAAALPK